jgi:glycogen operon protein
MLLMGDEVRRTQRGNNNAYVQDNEISWFDWSLVKSHQDIHRFVKSLIALRLRTDYSIGNLDFSLNEFLQHVRIESHGVKLHQPDWNTHSHSIAATAQSLSGNFAIHLMFNAYWEQLRFEIPSPYNFSDHPWRTWINTFQDSPHDINVSLDRAPIVHGSFYDVQPRSVVVLITLIEKDGGFYAGS